MVWKMMFEEFQDGCLVIGNLLYANGMILAVSESLCCMKPPSSFCSRGYNMVWKKILVEEFQDGCLVLGHLSYANGMN